MSRAQAMHQHSILAYHAGEGTFSRRERMVIDWIRANGRATDRQVMHGLGFSDMNAVRPRCTELVQAGALREVGSTICPVTGKRVRLVDLPEIQRELFS